MFWADVRPARSRYRSTAIVPLELVINCHRSHEIPTCRPRLPPRLLRQINLSRIHQVSPKVFLLFAARACCFVPACNWNFNSNRGFTNKRLGSWRWLLFLSFPTTMRAILSLDWPKRYLRSSFRVRVKSEFFVRKKDIINVSIVLFDYLSPSFRQFETRTTWYPHR